MTAEGFLGGAFEAGRNALAFSESLAEKAIEGLDAVTGGYGHLAGLLLVGLFGKPMVIGLGSLVSSLTGMVLKPVGGALRTFAENMGKKKGKGTEGAASGAPAEAQTPAKPAAH